MKNAKNNGQTETTTPTRSAPGIFTSEDPIWVRVPTAFPHSHPALHEPAVCSQGAGQDLVAPLMRKHLQQPRDSILDHFVPLGASVSLFGFQGLAVVNPCRC